MLGVLRRLAELNEPRVIDAYEREVSRLVDCGYEKEIRINIPKAQDSHFSFPSSVQVSDVTYLS
jgi:hypothetical protein